MDWGARSGWKLSKTPLPPGGRLGLNGLGCPFGMETIFARPEPFRIALAKCPGVPALDGTHLSSISMYPSNYWLIGLAGPFVLDTSVKQSPNPSFSFSRP